MAQSCGSGAHYVRGYTKSNGEHVRGHCSENPHRGRRGRGLGTTAGMHCVRRKRTSAGMRCAEFAPHHPTGRR